MTISFIKPTEISVHQHEATLRMNDKGGVCNIVHDYYLNFVINRLTDDDLSILDVLHANKATASFKALKNQEVISLCKLSEAKYRKSLVRLLSNVFVETVTGNKDHRLFITQYGLYAMASIASNTLKGDVEYVSKSTSSNYC